MKHLRRLEVLGAVFGVVFGTLLHFTYDWFGRHLVIGLFSAVNESVWEHTKLIITPVIIFGLIEWRLLRNPGKVLAAKALELLFGVVFIIAFFYTYTGALGIEEILTVDISSFIVAVLIGKFISYHVLKKERAPSAVGSIVSAIAIGLLLMMQVWFTIAAPKLPLFEERVEIAVPAIMSSADPLVQQRAAIAAAYPEFRDFLLTPGFAGHDERTVADEPDRYFAYLTLGSGVPIAAATCFRVDRLLRVYKVGEFPDPLDQVAGYTDVDPQTCRGKKPLS